MRILRVVHDYWPCFGGNERWSHLHDKWFSEVAGDMVRTLVLRPEALFDLPGYRTLLEDSRFDGPLEVPDLPKVRAHQKIMPAARRLGLIRSYWRALRPEIANSDVDIVITQIATPHALPCFRGKPTVLEPAALLCPYGSHVDCTRTRIWCGACFKSGGFRWWLRDQLAVTALSRFDLVVHNEITGRELKRLGLESRHHLLRFIIDRRELLIEAVKGVELRQKRMVEELASEYPFVLLQFNRLFQFKNPRLLLDVAERLPDCGVVFAGDGPEKENLESRVESSAALRSRVRFLGPVTASFIGSISEKASAIVLTSTLSNCNTSLFETMALGVAPVVAVDTRDFPDGFDGEEMILRTASDPDTMAAQIRKLLEDPNRRAAIAAAGRRYVENHHSIDQMWAYRQRLVELAQKYGSRNLDG